jgi:small subunit ribosomal protein S17
MTMADTTTRNTRKDRQGVVVSDKQDKTIVVRVDRFTTHPLYHKTIRVSKKYHVHDEANDANVGDTVLITETRPISKLKRWRLAQIIERAK